MNAIVTISRILVGALFIISGLIKVNDPVGFSFKLEEYFDVFAEDVKPVQDTLVLTTIYGDSSNVVNTELQLTAYDQNYVFNVDLSNPSIRNVYPDSLNIDSLQADSTVTDSMWNSWATERIPTADIIGNANNQAFFTAEMEFPDSESVNIPFQVTINGEELIKDEIVLAPGNESGLQRSIDVSSYVKEDGFLVGFFMWNRSMALELSMFISILEVALGVAVLMGSLPLLTSWLLLLMIIQFTFLTFYSAWFNKVTDCGCFGDALVLTPWESFTKDIVLLFFITIIFLGRKTIKSLHIKSDGVSLGIALLLITIFSLGVIDWTFPVIFVAIMFAVILAFKAVLKEDRTAWIYPVIGFAFCFGYSYYCVENLPVKDFRAYKIGTDIMADKSFPDGAKEDVVEMIFIYKNKTSGETAEFSASKLPADLADNWEYVDREDKLIEKGYEPPIHDFSITTLDGIEVTDSILTTEGLTLVVISYDLEKVGTENFDKVNMLQSELESEGVKFIGLTASGDVIVDAFRHEVQTEIRFFTTDQTALKTIIRSNYGLMLLEKGVIKGKWHRNNIPSPDQIRSDFMK